MFVFEVWGVYEYKRLVLSRDLEMFFQNAELVFGIFVEANFSDAQDVVFV